MMTDNKEYHLEVIKTFCTSGKTNNKNKIKKPCSPPWYSEQMALTNISL
jgi:hypothetical protein